MTTVKENLIDRDTYDFCYCATELFLTIEQDRGWEDQRAALIAAGLTTLHKLVEPTPNSWLSVMTAYTALQDDKEIKNIANEKDAGERYRIFSSFLRSCVAAYENEWYMPELLADAGNLADSFDTWQDKEKN